MASPLFGEFMGTLVLILLGDGVVANVLLKKSKGENSGWMVIEQDVKFGATVIPPAESVAASLRYLQRVVRDLETAPAR